MHHPVGPDLLGDAGLSGVEHLDRLLDGLAHRPLRADADIGAGLPGGVDGGGKIGQ